MVAPVAEQLASFRFGKPFRPFEIVFRDGSRVAIPDPEAVGWNVRRDLLSCAADDDSFIHAALSDVSLIRLLPSGENGASQ